MLVDGTSSFSGGMDSSRESSRISPEQCARLINCRITDVGDKVAARYGWRHQELQFESKRAKRIYENAENFQGEGWTYNGFGRIQLVSIDGYLLSFTRAGGESWSVRVLNTDSPNNPNQPKAWFTRVGGDQVIMQDGQGYPFLITGGIATRIDSDDTDNIGVGKFGAFVQGRYFYVDPTGSIIIASDLRDPTRRTEGALTNLYGFATNDVNDEVVAIGRQKHLSLDINGGSLVWSTNDDLYSADVRGDRTGWTASLVVAESGAVSHDSFENFGSNLYYRSAEKGITNYKQSAAQFISDADMYAESVEVAVWLSADTEVLLKYCYTESFKGRLLTTVCPTLHPSGRGVFHNGLVIHNPDPSYNSRSRLPRRYEGLWTGVRPWALTELRGNSSPTFLFCHSYDADGITRLYRLDEDIDHDVDQFGNQREIERVIHLRSFAFGSDAVTKEVRSHEYGLYDFNRATEVAVSHRPDDSGPWQEFWRVTHSVAEQCEEQETLGCYPKQDRPSVVMEKHRNNPDVPGVIPGRKAFHHSYRMEITGPGELGRFLVDAEESQHAVRVFKEPKQSPQSWVDPDDFSYSTALVATP